MTQDTAKKLLKINQDGYRAISEEFSQTRVALWQDLQPFNSFIKDDMSVLDVGCGNGRLFELFVNKNIKFTGIDLNPKFIELAKEKYASDPRKPQFFEGDILALSENGQIANQRFDAVFGVAVLHHIPHPQLQMAALRQMTLFLKPGGYLFLTNWNLWQLNFNHKGYWRSTWEKIFTSKRMILR